MTTLRAAVAAGVLITGSAVLAAQSQATYLHTLADFGGPLRYDGVHISIDRATDETYIINQNIVYVFNASGMQTFSFGEDLDVGQIVDVAVDRNGGFLLLSSRDGRSIVTRCTFRGVPIGPVEFSGFPAGLELMANRMMLRNGHLYLASLAESKVIVTDVAGVFRSSIDVFSQLLPEERMDDVQSVGFFVDDAGNIFLTMPTLFRVFKRAPDGTMASFGSAGSGQGKFGILGGIATDKAGNLFVADKLKCVVMVFDQDFRFLTEFGYRGPGAANLIVPDDVAVDRRGRIYVSQWRRRGVSVFSVDLR